MRTRLVVAAPLALMIYSAAVVCYHPAAKAQTDKIFEDTWKTLETLNNATGRVTEKVDGLDSRIGRNEAVVTTLQTKVDAISERLARIETSVDTISRLMWGIIASLVGLLMNAGWNLISTGKKRGDEGSGSHRAME